MDHREKSSAIQTQDFPAFLAALQNKYGEKYIEKSFAAMGVVAEQDGSSMFDTFGTGTNINLFRVAHALIRALGKEEMKGSPDEGTPGSELKAIARVMNVLWLNISKDLGREGIPDSIFSAFMQNQSPSTPHDQAP